MLSFAGPRLSVHSMLLLQNHQHPPTADHKCVAQTIAHSASSGVGFAAGVDMPIVNSTGAVCLCSYLWRSSQGASTTRSSRAHLGTLRLTMRWAPTATPTS